MISFPIIYMYETKTLFPIPIGHVVSILKCIVWWLALNNIGWGGFSEQLLGLGLEGLWDCRHIAGTENYFTPGLSNADLVWYVQCSLGQI